MNDPFGVFLSFGVFLLSTAVVVKTPLRRLGGQTTQASDSKRAQTLFPMSVDNSKTLSCEIDNPRL